VTLFLVARWGTNNLHFYFCFSDSLDWAGYDEKFKGRRSSNLSAAASFGEFVFGFQCAFYFDSGS
jgi:hypothetical protein